MAPAVGDGFQQSRNERRAHRVEFRGERIRDIDDLVFLAAWRVGERCLLFDKAEGHRFRQPGRGEYTADQVVARHAGIGWWNGSRHDRKRRLELIESVVASDL